MLQKPSSAVRLIRRLPARELALRLWNRVVRLRPEFVAETVFGARIHCHPRDIIQATIVHFGVWEPEITELFRALVRRGDVAVDVGANVGYYSMLFATLGADVIAIEALPQLAGEIERNARLNGLRIRIENVAVTEKAGKAMLYQAPDTNIGMSTLKTGAFSLGIAVPAAPLFDLLGTDLKRISLIKMDIEGAEAPPMRDIAANLDRFGERLAICVEAASDWAEAFERILAAGFRAWRIPNDLSTLWRRLLDDEPAGSLQPVTAFPREQCDLLLLSPQSARELAAAGYLPA